MRKYPVIQFEELIVDVTSSCTKMMTNEYHTHGKYPIIDQGQASIAGYTDRDDGLFVNVPVVVFGDHTRIIKYVNQPFFLGADGVKVLKAKNESVDYKYLYYALLAQKIPNTGYNRHYKWLKKTNILQPILPVQQRIAATLDAVSEVLRLRKAQLAELDNLVKSKFVEMFGDPDTNPMKLNEELLSVHLDVIGGYAFKSEFFRQTGIPILRIGNINSGHFTPTSMVYWQEDTLLKRYMMFPGDLVMSLTGTVGKDDYGNVCILSNKFQRYYLNQRNAKLSIKDTLNKQYLSELLKFDSIKKRLTGISRGVRQANISNRDILNLRVPIPDISLQNQFAAFVAQTDKCKAIIQQSLDETQRLFDSLMAEYFED